MIRSVATANGTAAFVHSNVPDPEATFTSVPSQITATWYRVTEFEGFAESPERVEERIQMTLVKKANR